MGIKLRAVAAGQAMTYNRLEELMTRVGLLKDVPLFAELSDAELAALAQDFTHLKFQQGEPIFYQGDPGHTLYIVEAGQVRIYVQSEDGQELSVTVCGPGDLFGEMAVIDGLPRSASAIAMEPTRVLSLSRERFREQLRRSPQFALNFMKALSVRIRSSTRTMDTLTTLNVPSRVARKLLELAQKHGAPEPGGVRLGLNLTQTDLASLLGTTRESINKALGQFKKQGWVSQQGGQIVIVDPEALRRLSQKRTN
jgi:CRP-like cAMP-binding protein